jgi:large subunit ribosomal protein L28
MASTMSALSSTYSGRAIAFRAAPAGRAGAVRPALRVEAKRVCDLTGGLLGGSGPGCGRGAGGGRHCGGGGGGAAGRRGGGGGGGAAAAAVPRSVAAVAAVAQRQRSGSAAAGGSRGGGNGSAAAGSGGGAHRQRQRQGVGQPRPLQTHAVEQGPPPRAARRGGGGSGGGRRGNRTAWLWRRRASWAEISSNFPGPAPDARAPLPPHPHPLAKGKKRNKANVVTFSNKHNRKWQEPNLQHKKVYWEHGQRWVKLKICTKAIKTIEKVGLDAMAKEAGIDLWKLPFEDARPERLAYLEANKGKVPVVSAVVWGMGGGGGAPACASLRDGVGRGARGAVCFSAPRAPARAPQGCCPSPRPRPSLTLDRHPPAPARAPGRQPSRDEERREARGLDQEAQVPGVRGGRPHRVDPPRHGGAHLRQRQRRQHQRRGGGGGGGGGGARGGGVTAARSSRPLDPRPRAPSLPAPAPFIRGTAPGAALSYPPSHERSMRVN